MPELTNLRHERFSQNLAMGMNAGPAYSGAGYKAIGHSADVAASRLLKNVDVRARVAELMAPALERTEVTVERVLKEMACHAFCDITEIFESDGGRLTIKDPRTLSEGLRRSITGVKVFRVGEKTTYEIRFANKQRALESLARHLQMFKETVLVENVFQEIQDMSDEELERRVAELDQAYRAEIRAIESLTVLYQVI
jgi:phage terminase small subunit